MYSKKCSLSLIIREMKIKATLRYQLILARVAIIKTIPKKKGSYILWQTSVIPALGRLRQEDQGQLGLHSAKTRQQISAGMCRKENLHILLEKT
jgi:hypothetical protein